MGLENGFLDCTKRPSMVKKELGDICVQGEASIMLLLCCCERGVLGLGRPGEERLRR